MVDAKRLLPVFANEKAEDDAGAADPKAGVDWPPNTEEVAPKAGADCAPKMLGVGAG